MAHPRGTHSRYVIGCCLIPLGICGFENNSRRITYGIGRVWGMPSLSPLSSLVLTHFSRIERTKTTLTCSQRPNTRYDSFLKCRNYAETTRACTCELIIDWQSPSVDLEDRWPLQYTITKWFGITSGEINGRTFTHINEPLRRTNQAWMRQESGIITEKIGDFGAAAWLKSSFWLLKRWLL